MRCRDLAFFLCLLPCAGSLADGSPTAKSFTRVFTLPPVVIQADPEPAVSQSRITRDQIRVIPGIANDPLRAIQKLPGVVSPSDFSGQLAVRGGGPQDNLYYINDIPWPIPFHFGGLLSTVGGDALDRVDLYAAAFPAKWGGVDGAVLDAVTRRDLGSRWSGRLDLNLLLVDFFIEGPIAGGGFSMWARRSYFDLIAPSVIGNEFTALPFFWDLGGTYQRKFGQSHTLRGFFNTTEDVLGLDIGKEDAVQDAQAGEVRFRNRYTTGGINWIWDISDSLQSRVTPYYYIFNVEVSFGAGFRFDLLPKVGGVRWDVEYKAAPGHTLKMGTGAQLEKVEVYGFLPRRLEGHGSNSTVVSDPQPLSVSTRIYSQYVYAQDTLTLGNWEFEPGLRLNIPAQKDRLSLGLRFRAKWEYEPDRRVYAAWGQYHQTPTGQELNDTFGNPDLKFNLTDHYVAGWESRLRPQMLLRVESYYKNYRRRVVPVDDGRLYANEGEGMARGLELLLKYDEGSDFFGWLSWSWSRSERSNLYGKGTALYEFDQPHVITAVGSYALSQAFRLGATASYHSGALITPIRGRFYDPLASRWMPVFGNEYSERLADYLRVDVRADYTWIFETWVLGLYLEILNVTQSKNPIGYSYSANFTQKNEVGQIPFLPYLGIRASF